MGRLESTLQSIISWQPDFSPERSFPDLEPGPAEDDHGLSFLFRFAREADFNTTGQVTVDVSLDIDRRNAAGLFLDPGDLFLPVIRR